MQIFAVVARFQDDIFVGEAPYFQRAIDGQVYWSAESPTTSAVQDPAHPFKGCYPCQFIQINPEQRSEKKNGFSVTHQDIRIYRTITGNDKAVKFHTAMYDKKEKLKATGRFFVYYPAVDSMVSPKCKYGIVNARAFAFARRCSKGESFRKALVEVVTHLMETNRYSLRKCLVRLRAFCIKRPNLYGAKSFRTHYNPVSKELHRLYRSLQDPPEY